MTGSFEMYLIDRNSVFQVHYFILYPFIIHTPNCNNVDKTKGKSQIGIK